ncbi:MAG: HisA/HisF-related TIM barrel protein [Nitrospira sp.]
MRVIPAIDLKDGRCVRLRQGDMAAETVYSEDVPSVARRWQEQGADLIHIVDLNGAVDGGAKEPSPNRSRHEGCQRKSAGRGRYPYH